MNRVVLIGRLTRDPELRHTQSGIATCSFILAVNRSFTNQQGERDADFIPIVTWRGLAENCHKFLSKGRLVGVSGRIQTRRYETDTGQRRYITEVVADEVQFLERSRDAHSVVSANESTGLEGFEPVDDDGELPF